MKKQRRVRNRYSVLRDRWGGGGPWTAKQHHWESEAKESHQLRQDKTNLIHLVV